MNINLQDLGINAEKIQDAVVQEITERILTGERGWDESKFRRQMDEQIKTQVRAGIDKVIAACLQGTIDAQIENLKFEKTNGYGEKKAEPQTIREWINERLSAYLAEEVNENCESRSELRHYDNFRPKGKRIIVMFNAAMKDELQQSVNAIWREGNKPLLAAVQEAVTTQLGYLKDNLKLFAGTHPPK